MVKTNYNEVWTKDLLQRQIVDAGQEANRRATIALDDLRPTSKIYTESSTAKFGELMLVDVSDGEIYLSLPATTQADVGRNIIVKLWTGFPRYKCFIKAPLDGLIDGNDVWELNQAFECITLVYAGNNAWCITAKASGSGSIVI